MNKAVLISIQPYYVFLIIARTMGWNIPQNKTIEVRKDFPKDSEWNRRVHIYCSKNRKSFNQIPARYQPFMEKLLGKVIGEFVCDWVMPLFNVATTPWRLLSGDVHERAKELVKKACLTEEEMLSYSKGKNCYVWRISDLKIYDEPKELGEFKGYCSKKVECYQDYIRHCNHSHLSWKCNPLTRAPQSFCYVEEI